MSLDFFRRPQLAGKNISRTQVATVRGSLRRSDPDGFSTVPYFPGVVATQTLVIVHQAGTTTVNLTGGDLATVLSDISTALGVNGSAVDADGTVQIQSAVIGAGGFIHVTGGTASSLLGFETYGGARPIQANGGEIPSSPELRIGNPFGTAFTAKKENYTAESMTRGLARMASNTDVLWLDQSKDRMQLKSVAFSVGTGGLFITPTAAQRMFVGGPNAGGLTAASSKSDLIPYYQIIDTVTGLPAASQVVAVVRGTPVGDPPYANSPSWTDSTGKNVLGLDQAKASGVTISAIDGGKYVTCSGATFITNGVKVGDYAAIAAATNLSQWSNNGYRWIVEEVLSETVDLALRPMTKSELAIVATTVTDVQPILELSDQKGGLEVFGTLTISTGPWAHNVNLVVRPPIPIGAVYDLRAGVPSSLRDDLGLESRFSSQGASMDMATPYSPVYDGAISGLGASLTGPNCVIATGLIRWHGRVYSVPTATFLPGAFGNGLNYVYWSDSTTLLTTTQNPNDFRDVYNPAVTTNKGHLVALVTVAGGVITEVDSAHRLTADASIPITVGVGGQFPSLAEASLWAGTLAAAYGETDSASGSYPHFEFILVSDTTLASNTPIQVPSAIIRGANPRVKLTMGAFSLGQNSSFGVALQHLEIRDLAISSSGAGVFDASLATPVQKVIIKNVAHVSGTLAAVVKNHSSGIINLVDISNSEFTVSSNVVAGQGSGGKGIDRIRLYNSKFTFSGSDGHVIDHQTPGTAWDGTLLIIKDCEFLGGWVSANNNPIIVKETGTVAATRILIDNVSLALGSPNADPAITTPLVACSKHTILNNVSTISGWCAAVVAGNINTTVSNCSFIVSSAGISNIALTAGSIYGTSLTHVTPGTIVGTNAGIGVWARGYAVNNTITGPFYQSITNNSDSNVLISGNDITQPTDADFTTTDACVFIKGGSFVEVSDNYLTTAWNFDTAPTYCIELGSTSTAKCLIAKNRLFHNYAAPTTTSLGSAIAVTGSAPTDLTIQDNTISATSSSYALNPMIDVSSMTGGVVSGNMIDITGADTSSSVGIQTGANTSNVTFQGNYVSAGLLGTAINTGDLSSTIHHLLWVGNHIIGGMQGMHGHIIGNEIQSSVVHELYCVRFSDNYVTGPSIKLHVTAFPNGVIQVTNNNMNMTVAVDGGSSSTSAGIINYSQNYSVATTIEGLKISMVGNHVTGACVIDNQPGLTDTADWFVSDNNFGSTFTANDTTSGPSASTNTFAFVGNNVTGLATFTHPNQHISCSNFQAGANLSAGDIALSNVVFSGNECIGPFSALSGHRWLITGNYLRNNSDAYPVQFADAMVIGSITITGNTILQDNTGISPFATGISGVFGVRGCIHFGTNTANNVCISGNYLTMTDTTVRAAATNGSDIDGWIITGTSSTGGINISSNTFRRPTDPGTFNAHAYHYFLCSLAVTAGGAMWSSNAGFDSTQGIAGAGGADASGGTQYFQNAGTIAVT